MLCKCVTYLFLGSYVKKSISDSRCNLSPRTGSFGVWTPVGGRDFLFFISGQTGPRVQAASFVIGTVDIETLKLPEPTAYYPPARSDEVYNE